MKRSGEKEGEKNVVCFLTHTHKHTMCFVDFLISKSLFKY